jgi:serine/threonine-protein kinase
MKAALPAPLAGVASCQSIQEFHPAVAAPGSGMPQPGEFLDDRFLITEVISRTGQAMIFKAQDFQNGNTDVAIKMPHPDWAADAGFIDRFKQEEAIGLQLDHPYVLRFIPVTTPRSRPYIVAEYLRGCTLAHLLEAMSPLPEGDALKIASLIAEALEYLHAQGVVHRDLKPHNVMIGCDGTIRLLDFGLARSSGSPRPASAGARAAMGTPDYMAPEQVQGKPGDARTDVYGLGAMLYEMLTGQPPFAGDNPLVLMNARLLADPDPVRSINSAISAPTEKIVMQALARKPGQRPSSARSMRMGLDRCIASADAEARSPATPGKTAQPSLSQGRLMMIALAASVIVPAVLALGLWLCGAVR